MWHINWIQDFLRFPCPTRHLGCVWLEKMHAPVPPPEYPWHRFVDYVQHLWSPVIAFHICYDKSDYINWSRGMLPNFRSESLKQVPEKWQSRREAKQTVCFKLAWKLDRNQFKLQIQPGKTDRDSGGPNSWVMLKPTKRKKPGGLRIILCTHILTCT